VCIEKMMVSSLYSDCGFSKRMLRKLQHSNGIESIRVWSLKEAESFYKALGFRNVYANNSNVCTDNGKPARHKRLERKSGMMRVEGLHGPLLVWEKQVRRLQTKDSMVSVSGSSAYNPMSNA
jgi:hypothetical protein